MSAGNRTGMERKLYALALVVSLVLIVAGIWVLKSRRQNPTRQVTVVRQTKTTRAKPRPKTSAVHLPSAKSVVVRTSPQNIKTSPPATEGPQVIVRQTGFTDSGNQSIAVVDKASGRGSIIAPGELTPDGYLFVSADAQLNTVQFEKDGRTFTSLITPFENAPAVQDDSTRAHATDVAGAIESDSPSATGVPQGAIASQPFRAVTLQTGAGVQITLTPVPNNQNVVAMQTAGKTYVLPRDVTEAMINNKSMTVDQQANAIITSPSLTEVHPGQDPASVGEKARQNPLQPPSLPPGLNIPPLPQSAPSIQ